MVQSPEHDRWEEPLPEPEERTRIRAKLTDLLEEVGNNFIETAFADPLPLHQSHDVHAFYRSTISDNYVIHVQASPDLCTKERAYVIAHVLNYKEMLTLRENGTHIGNERSARVGEGPLFKIELYKYNAKTLENTIKKHMVGTIISVEDYFIHKIMK